MILLSHPTGNANIRHAVLALAEAGILSEFWTSLSWNPEGGLAKCLPHTWQKQMARRAFPERVRSHTYTFPWREMGRLLASQMGLASLTRHEQGIFSVDAVFQAFDDRVAHRLTRRHDLQGVYCGEDAACRTFQQARQSNLLCFYDLPIGYWRAGHEIFHEEREREPEWAMTLGGLKDSAFKLERKEQELSAADVVFVASSFTQQTLTYAPTFRGKVCVAPYGAPPIMENFAPTKTTVPLRALYVGSLTQRKGLSYLFSAVEALRPHVELTLIGRRPGVSCRPLEQALGRHRWIESLPHAEVLNEMGRHDILIFPSLFEGFGLVILEAMSQGIPVITTHHTAGPDCITNGEEGFLVPIRSSDSIVAALSLLLERPDLLVDMKHAARRKAGVLEWKSYRTALQQGLCTQIQTTRMVSHIS